ncbi:FG-GAP repeat protein [Streptomyces sp. YIM 130001]|uniref:FG-GAP and VCBS repeat-containing protein n=1 Tax=Streptomyces sp. YIM 130001 TaxID=2259644 RepID=UPI000ECBC3F1|nr:FG-GAP and VCBS repeat-containing protein [Streptomyces sp. YIM 130001]RII21034.1 FG-GAP repeat protein [Streptomyces sp. YIM 130001]
MRKTPHALAARCAVVAALLTAPIAAAFPASAAEPAADAPSAAAPDADFDGDGQADVVTAAPEATVSGAENAGYVTVVYGSAAGKEVRHQTVSQNTPSADAYFGRESVARDLDGDGYTDLAVVSDKTVSVHWGSETGLSGESTPLPDSANVSGFVLAGGDFDGDGNADLVTGDDEGDAGWGGLQIQYGPFDRDAAPARTDHLDTDRTFAPHSLTAGDVTGDGKDDLVTTHHFEEKAESSQFWAGTADGLSTKSTELPGAAEATIGDVDNDGHGDVVLRTVPGDIVEDLPDDHGTLEVLYGTESGPSTTRTTTIDQETAGVPGVNEAGDRFGHSLSAGDTDGDGYADVAVGIPGEDFDGMKDAGSTVLLKGGSSGLSGAGAKAYDQDTAGVPGVAEAGDEFGRAVAVPGGGAGFAAGAPGEDTASPDSGAAWLRLGTSGTYAVDPSDLMESPAAGGGLGGSFAH